MNISSSEDSGSRGNGHSKKASFLSLAIRSDGWPCLVIGGGRVATRKAVNLYRHGAKVTVISPRISQWLKIMVKRGQIRWCAAEYETSWLTGFRLIIAATDKPELNLQIGRDAEKAQILCCVTSSAEHSRVIFPAVYEAEDISIAVHSYCRDCRRSQAVRDRIALDFSSTKSLKMPKYCEWAEEVEIYDEGKLSESGKVYIIGAGPGAPDLITMRGYRALRLADAILVDELLPASFLEELGISSANKLVEHLGNNKRHWNQEEINRWLITSAIHGKIVVRLKGGDPFIFGRGDNEIEALSQVGIPWEVIPGPSAATAVATTAGFPLTRHAQGRSFAVATARIEGGCLLSSFPGADSLVILMGIAVLGRVIDKLLSDGWSSNTPAAIIERGCLSWERHVKGPLRELERLASQAYIASPAVVIIGEAARMVTAVQDRPNILFTGLDATNFRTLGNILHWPAQTILPNLQGQRLFSQAVIAVGRGNIGWLVFTDKFAVRTFFMLMSEYQYDARLLGNTKIAVVGPETRLQLEYHNFWANATLTEDGLFPPATSLGNISGESILVIQGSHTPRGLCKQLKLSSAIVERLILNRLVPHPELGRPLPQHDVIYFVSPGGVKAYANAYGKAAFQQKVWCFGQATKQALATYGVSATVVRPLEVSNVDSVEQDIATFG